MFIMGIGVSLGFGIWADITPFGDRNILDSLDYIASNILLPLGGLAMALLAGWYLKKEHVFEAFDIKGSAYAPFFHFIIKYVAPLIILFIFINQLLAL